jgi:hypothetical protein
MVTKIMISINKMIVILRNMVSLSLSLHLLDKNNLDAVLSQTSGSLNVLQCSFPYTYIRNVKVNVKLSLCLTKYYAHNV